MLKTLLKKKELLMTIGAVALLIIGYQFAFSKTMDAWQLNKQLTIQAIPTNDMIEQPSYVLRKGKNIRAILNLYKVDTVELRNSILSRIADIAENEKIHLSEVPLRNIADTSNHILIQKLDFEGTFSSLLKFLDRVNRTDNVGVISSVLIKNTTKAGDEYKGQLLGEVYFEMLNRSK